MTEKPGVFIRYLFPRLQDVLFVSLLMAIVLYGPRLLNQDGDLGRHITIGRYILAAGTIPLQDIFSHTRDGWPLVPHEWLSQVFLALAYKALGLDGNVLLTGIIVAFTFLLVYRETLRRGVPRLLAFTVVILAAGASSIHWLARPHVFTFLLLAVWTIQLERFSENERMTFLFLPVIMLIWVNTHGGFIAGFVVLGTFVTEWFVEFNQGKASIEKGKQLGWITFSTFLVSFLNPAGWHLWETSLGYVGNDYLVSHTVEYFPPNFHNPLTWPFLFMIALGLLATTGSKQVRLHDRLLIAGLAAMGLYSARNIPLFAIVTAPIYGELTKIYTEKTAWIVRPEATVERIEQKSSGLFWPALTIMCLLMIFLQNIPLDSNRQGNAFNQNLFPVQATNWLEQNPQKGNVFNYFTWGGYLLFRRWPEQKVFIDGQTDFYGEALTREYEIAISAAPGWEGILEKYNVSWAIIPINSKLSVVLIEAGWERLYEDQTAIILQKP